VIGCAVALELARAGRRVAVVDRNGAPGAGSTSASAAIIRFHYSTYVGVAAAWEAKHMWERWAEHLGVPDPAGLARYVRTGGLVLDTPGGTPGKVEALFDRVGIPYERWDAATIRRRLPWLDPARHWPPKRPDDDRFWADPDGELGAFYTPEGGFVDDPQLAAHNLMVAAQASGAELLLHRTVTAIDRAGDRVSGVALASGERVAAPVVVNVAGPHSGRINAMAGVEDDFAITTRPLRQEVHSLQAPAGFDVDQGPFVTDADLGVYARPHFAGTMLVGSLEPECDPLEWLDDPDVYVAHPTRAVWDAQVLRVARRMPDVHVPHAPVGVVGIYDVSDDWVPIYDRTSLDGFYVAIGTSGNQFKNAPLVGRFLAELVAASDAGHDHDASPVQVTGRHTGLVIDLSRYSRRRQVTAESSFSVLG
jgi:sarcosine oxidase subunit beta